MGISSPKASLNSLNGDSFQIQTNIINRLVYFWTKVVPDMASEAFVIIGVAPQAEREKN